jgi:drug/metabolite transporter (DMT)-like permease
LLACLEPVWGILFALALLGEKPTVRTLLGGAIILAATLVPATSAMWNRAKARGGQPDLGQSAFL